ncbi:MAG: class I SAM-dependent methyltransferase [Gammaproteobacteria bacterium]
MLKQDARALTSAIPVAPPPSRDPAPHQTTGRPTFPDRWLVRRLLEVAGQPPVTIVLPDGTTVAGATGADGPRLVIRDRIALQRLLANPEYEFGELYSAGRVDIEGDLPAFLDIIYRHITATTEKGLRALVLRALSKHQHNTQERARERTRHHYDIGNDFYRLWLDKDMVYTCAYFADPDATLEQAQTAKLDYVCRKLRLKPGERVVEAGCGWGALALYMAKHYGVHVKAYNISQEQIAYARERVQREGLQDHVEFIEDDYRAIRGSYDAFVSVGMLEHVGVDNFATLGSVIDSVLTANGRGLIHSIGRDKPGPMNPWIARRIFPGAYPPSISEMMHIFEPSGLSVLDVENLRLHYAQTLRHWLARYEASVERVAEMFDQIFVRMWRLYLAGSLAAFTSGEMQLLQVVFNRHGNNDGPRTREFLYRQTS